MNTLDMVRQFHLSFGHPIKESPDIHDMPLSILRIALLEEEVEELAGALSDGTEEDVLDALCDIQYVLDGAFLALGFARYKDPAFLEVHRANMDKLDSNGKPIFRTDGKVLKPPGWLPPNLKGVLSLHS